MSCSAVILPFVTILPGMYNHSWLRFSLSFCGMFEVGCCSLKNNKISISQKSCITVDVWNDIMNVCHLLVILIFHNNCVGMYYPLLICEEYIRHGCAYLLTYTYSTYYRQSRLENVILFCDKPEVVKTSFSGCSRIKTLLSWNILFQYIKKQQCFT